jgi:hypothetical protein
VEVVNDRKENYPEKNSMSYNRKTTKVKLKKKIASMKYLGETEASEQIRLIN